MMSKRSVEYFYKTCDLDEKSMKDKKRYEILNEFGYNFDSNSKRVRDVELSIKRCRNR